MPTTTTRPTVRKTPLLWVSLNTPDGRVLVEFYRWMDQTDVRAVAVAPLRGTTWQGGFRLEDIEAVEAWLREHGVETEEA